MHAPPGMAMLPTVWRRWRRLCLRLGLAYAIAAQTFLQAMVSDPGGRIERQAHRRQRRQRLQAEEAAAADPLRPAAAAAALAAPVPPPPPPPVLAKVVGKGQYLKPIIPHTSQCHHAVTHSGGNATRSWTICSTCGYQVTINTVDIKLLEEFNAGRVLANAVMKPPSATSMASGGTRALAPPPPPPPPPPDEPEPLPPSPPPSPRPLRPAVTSPTCPQCYGVMQVKVNRSDGEEFWGCPSFPICRGTRPMKVGPQARH